MHRTVGGGMYWREASRGRQGGSSGRESVMGALVSIRQREGVLRRPKREAESREGHSLVDGVCLRDQERQDVLERGPKREAGGRKATAWWTQRA